MIQFNGMGFTAIFDFEKDLYYTCFVFNEIMVKLYITLVFWTLLCMLGEKIPLMREIEYFVLKECRLFLYNCLKYLKK